MGQWETADETLRMLVEEELIDRDIVHGMDEIDY